MANILINSNRFNRLKENIYSDLRKKIPTDKKIYDVYVCVDPYVYKVYNVGFFGYAEIYDVMYEFGYQLSVKELFYCDNKFFVEKMRDINSVMEKLAIEVKKYILEKEQFEKSINETSEDGAIEKNGDIGEYL